MMMLIMLLRCVYTTSSAAAAAGGIKACSVQSPDTKRLREPSWYRVAKAGLYLSRWGNDHSGGVGGGGFMSSRRRAELWRCGCGVGALYLCSLCGVSGRGRPLIPSTSLLARCANCDGDFSIILPVENKKRA